MEQLGIGAMLQILGGNESSYKAYHESLNKKITAIKLDPELNGGDGALVISFKDGTNLMLCDKARSCCESRWMSTDDDLTHYVGGTLKDIGIKAGPETDADGEPTESMFMHVKTTKGTFVVNTYNSHNGYYGGIYIEASLTTD